MSKNRIKAVIVIGIAAIMLIVFVQYNKSESQIDLDESKFEIFDSEQDLMNELDNYHTPFSLARQIGVTEELNKKVPILKLNRTITIEEAWMEGPGRLLLIHSIDLQQKDNQQTVPDLQIGEITYKNKNGEEYTSKIEEDNPGYFDQEDKTVHNGKLYQMSLFYAEDLYRNMEFDDIVGFFDDVTEVSLGNIHMTENEKTANLDDYSFSVHPTAIDDFFMNVPIDNEIALPDNENVTFEQLDIGLFMNRLVIEPDTTNPISGFYLNNSVPDREFQTFQHVQYQQEGQPFISQSPFPEIPEQTEIKFSAIQYFTDAILEASVARDELANLLESKTDKIDLGEKHGFRFFLQAPDATSENLELSYQVPELISDWHQVLPLSINTKKRLDEWLSNVSNEEERNRIINNESILTVKNNEDKALEVDELFRNSEYSFVINMDESNWLKEEVIHLNIAGIPLIKELNTKVTIEIPEYQQSKK
ncbi:hypothetical protein [Aquibacillus saliphilus]|uniref:hypothetical protein n=1 Tax=Aquibacillus saliphilus TaxID=1909422 RepID=UPI001CF03E4C|nr:hypothetical protein [Aquibacillus saliphilus]